MATIAKKQLQKNKCKQRDDAVLLSYAHPAGFLCKKSKLQFAAVVFNPGIDDEVGEKQIARLSI